MNDFIIEKDVLKGYTGSDKRIKIPEGVRVLARASLFGRDFEEIIFPRTLEETVCMPLGFNQGLREVRFPEGMKVIGWKTFLECHNLKYVYIPSSVVKIDKMVFFNCDGLEKVEILADIKELLYGTFVFCRSLKEVILPKNLTKICGTCFCDNYALKTINLPETLEWIGDGAFVRSGLEKIYIPKNCKHIGERCFEDCDNLKEITAPKGLDLSLANIPKTCKVIYYA